MYTDMNQILNKVQQAAAGELTGLSTEEALIAALVLNRPDWLDQMRYTVAQALDRIGPLWATAIPSIAQSLSDSQRADERRYSYRIEPLSDDDPQAGYQLRLFEDDKEIDGGLFRPNGEVPDQAYAEAVAAAFAWLDGRAGRSKERKAA